jgi:hypothetical protein
MYAPSDLHATLIKVIHRLIPTAWLWEEHPAYARRHLDVIDTILFELGVNQWGWEAGAKKADYVPILLSALVMRTSGKPTEKEPALATRLITSLLKAGATPQQYGNQALIARAEQCTWNHVAQLLRQLGVDGSDLNTALDFHSLAVASSTKLEDPIDEELAADIEVELPVHPLTEEGESQPSPVGASDQVASPEVGDTATSPAINLEEAEILVQEAEENLQRVRAESEAYERERLEVLREMTLSIEAGDEDLGDESDDEDAILNMDPEELVQLELARLRESMPSFKRSADAPNAVEEGASETEDEGEDSDDVFTEGARSMDETVDILKKHILDFQDAEQEGADVGSNDVLSSCIKVRYTLSDFRS